MKELDNLLKMQNDILLKLKERSFSEIGSLPSTENIPLGQEYLNYKMFIYKNNNENGSIELKVEIENHNKYDLPEEMKKIMLNAVGVLPTSIGPSLYTDGFDIYPDGTIIPMHDDEYDPED